MDGAPEVLMCSIFKLLVPLTANRFLNKKLGFYMPQPA